MNDRDWIGELSSYLQQSFLQLCELSGQPHSIRELRINPLLAIEEAKNFLIGLESGLFLFDENGSVQSESLPYPSRPGFRQTLCQVFSVSPQPRLFRESICQLATVSALVLRRGWLSKQVKMDPDDAVNYGVDVVVESDSGEILVCVEIKRSSHELQKFSSDFRQCCNRGEHAKADCAFQQNHAMFEFCLREQPTYLWAAAPESEICLKLSYANAFIEIEESSTLPPRSHIEFGLSSAPPQQ